MSVGAINTTRPNHPTDLVLNGIPEGTAIEGIVGCFVQPEPTLRQLLEPQLVGEVAGKTNEDVLLRGKIEERAVRQGYVPQRYDEWIKWVSLCQAPNSTPFKELTNGLYNAEGIDGPCGTHGDYKGPSEEIYDIKEVCELVKDCHLISDYKIENAFRIKALYKGKWLDTNFAFLYYLHHNKITDVEIVNWQEGQEHASLYVSAEWQKWQAKHGDTNTA